MSDSAVIPLWTSTTLFAELQDIPMAFDDTGL